MVKRCAYGICKSDTRYPKSLEGGVVFFPFPKPKTQEDRCRMWIKRCGRPHSQLNISKINRHTYVCSKHFVNGQPTPEFPNPALAVQVPGQTRRGPGGSHKPSTQRRRLSVQDASASSSSTIEAEETQQCVADSDCLVISAATISDTSSSARPPEPQREDPVPHDHDYCRMDVRITVCGENRHFTLRTGSDALFYTGMTLETFNLLVSTLEGHGSGEFSLPVRAQVLMTLMKLKTNYALGDLSRRFVTPRSTASKIISYWMDKLEEVLGPLILWLPKGAIYATMPEAFKKNYPNTTYVIDCCEAWLENPKHSDSHHTVKYQVAVAPCGLIMFISAAYGGRCSEKLITEDSGLLDYITPGDEVMTNSSIKDLLLERDVRLVTPSFTVHHRRLDEGQVVSTRKTTHVGVHVKEAIRRLKTFKILSQVVPVTMVPKINKILRICAALVNLREDFVCDSR